MRNWLIVCALLLFSGVTWGGAYDEILDASERADTAKVIDLLQRGMDVNTADSSGNTLLMLAARTNNLDLVRFLLGNRARVNHRNRFGDTPVLVAAIKGHLDAVKLIHEAGGQLDPGGWNALHYGVFAEGMEILGWVMKRGEVKLDSRAPNGQTALMLAAKQGRMDAVQALIEADADMDLADYQGQTALQLAKAAGHGEIAKYLRSVGAVE